MSELHRRDYQPGTPGALDGVRVLDLSRLFAGNVLTPDPRRFRRRGDQGRAAAQATRCARGRPKGVATHWKIYARNKKSLCLELRDAEAREIIAQAGADGRRCSSRAFVPACSEKMGLAPEALLAINPQLVIVRISGWGQDGPYRAAAGLRHAGRRHVGLRRDQRLRRSRAGAAADVSGRRRSPGSTARRAAMIALREVEVNGGSGQVIDLPLLDPLFAVLGPQAANYRLTGKVKPRTGSRSTNSGAAQRLSLQGRPLRRPVRLDRRKWPSGCSARSAAPSSIDDPRFRTNADRRAPRRGARRDHRRVHRRSARRPRTSPSSRRPRSRSARSTTSRRSSTDPHLIERELIADYPDPEMEPLPMHHVVPRLLGTPGSIRTPAPSARRAQPRIAGRDRHR